MKFRLTADCQFEAESIDDAFAKLQEYFKHLAEDDDFLASESIIQLGEIHIEPM